MIIKNDEKGIFKLTEDGLYKINTEDTKNNIKEASGYWVEDEASTALQPGKIIS